MAKLIISSRHKSYTIESDSHELFSSRFNTLLYKHRNVFGFSIADIVSIEAIGFTYLSISNDILSDYPIDFVINNCLCTRLVLVNAQNVEIIHNMDDTLVSELEVHPNANIFGDTHNARIDLYDWEFLNSVHINP